MIHGRSTGSLRHPVGVSTRVERWEAGARRALLPLLRRATNRFRADAVRGLARGSEDSSPADLLEPSGVRVASDLYVGAEEGSKSEGRRDKMVKPIIATDENFEIEVLKADTPVLVDFYADWCGPCRIMAPVIEEVAGELEGRARVAKLDVDTNPQTAAKYGIRSIPTLLIFDGGKPVAQAVGALPKPALTQALENLIAAPEAA